MSRNTAMTDTGSSEGRHAPPHQQADKLSGSQPCLQNGRLITTPREDCGRLPVDLFKDGQMKLAPITKNCSVFKRFDSCGLISRALSMQVRSQHFPFEGVSAARYSASLPSMATGEFRIWRNREDARITALAVVNNNCSPVVRIFKCGRRRVGVLSIHRQRLLGMPDAYRCSTATCYRLSAFR